VPLRPKAWALLRHLAERPGVLVTKEELHPAVWGDTVVSDDTLTRTMAEVRRALRDDARTPRFIETVHRRGFRFLGRQHEPAGKELAPAMPAAPLPPEAPVLVGRDGDRAALHAQLRQAKAGRRAVVFVQGEAGIGKTALVEHFLRDATAADESVLVGYGQCVEQFGQKEPFMPALEILERLSQGPARPALLSALRSIAPSWLVQLPALQTPIDEERLRRWHGETTPHRMLREFSGLIEAIASERTVILVLEDLHWSDQATVDLISVLAQRSDRARLLLVGTLRAAQAAALDHPIQQVLTLLRARRRCAEIGLEYLTRRDVDAYLEHRLPGARVADEVAAAVHAHTDGNPLFITVLLHDLLARGWLAQDDGTWWLTVNRTTIAEDVPDNLRQLIEGQLRFASPEEEAVLEAASVAGVAFDVPAVAVGAGGDVDAVEAICHRLSRTGRWLQEQGNRHWPDGAVASRYAFRHALYQRTLYERLSPGRRAALHEQIGRRLEAAYGGRAGEAAADLARHFQGSHDDRRALVYLEQAANQAYERRAYADVVATLVPALHLLDDLGDTPERRRLELQLRQLYASVLSQTAGYTTAGVLENLARMRVLCQQLGDAVGLFDALCTLYSFHANGGEIGLAERLDGELARLTERLDASAALHYHFLRGGTVVWCGGLGDAGALLSRALESPVSLEEAYRPYGVNPVVGARSFEGLRQWIIGDVPAAYSLHKDAVALAERLGRPFTLAQALTFSACVLLLEQEWAEAGKRAARILALSDEYGFPRWRGRGLLIRGRVLLEEGDAVRGLAAMREGLEGLGRSGLRLGHSMHLSLCADAFLRAGRLDEAASAVDAGLAHCRDAGERLFEPELWRLRGEILARGGVRRRRREPGRADAENCFERARALARARGAGMLERRAGGRRYGAVTRGRDRERALGAAARRPPSAGARGAPRTTPS
jgi:hypothetical protein